MIKNLDNVSELIIDYLTIHKLNPNDCEDIDEVSDCAVWNSALDHIVEEIRKSNEFYRFYMINVKNKDTAAALYNTVNGFLSENRKVK